MLTRNLLKITSKGISLTISLCEQPGDSKLAWGISLLFGDGTEELRQFQVVVEVVLREAGHESAVVFLVELVPARESTGQETTAKRRVCDDFDTQLARNFQEIRLSRLNLERKWRVLHLNRGDRMHGVRTSQAALRALGEPQVPDLALFLELHHGLDGVLDGRLGVHAMLVVQVDVVGLQTLQAGIAGLLHVRGIAHDRPLAIHQPVRELGGEEDLIPAAGLLEPLPDQLLVAKYALG